MKAFHEQRLLPEKLPLLLLQGKGIDFLAHWQNEIEILFVAAGRQTVGINYQTYELEAGQTVFIAPGDIHYYSGCDYPEAYSPETSATEHESYLLIFPAALIAPFNSEVSKVWSPAAPALRNEIRSYIQKLKLLTASEKEYYELQGRAYLQLLTASLFQEPSESVSTGLKPPASLTQIPQILTYLNDHYAASISRDQIAALFSLSPAHFSRIFRNATGLPFSVYLRQLRIQKACEKLTRTQLTITEIALSCGFDSVRTFNRVFYQAAGMQPSEYRKRIT